MVTEQRGTLEAGRRGHVVIRVNLKTPPPFILHYYSGFNQQFFYFNYYYCTIFRERQKD